MAAGHSEGSRVLVHHFRKNTLGARDVLGVQDRHQRVAFAQYVGGTLVGRRRDSGMASPLAASERASRVAALY